MFLALGTVILYLALTNNLITHASYQISINVYLAKTTRFIGQYTKIIPEPIWALVFLVVFLAIVGMSIKQLWSLKVKTVQDKEEGDKG